jgi:hypothetical protein
MTAGYIIQIILFALSAMFVLFIFIAAALAIPRPGKGKSYRYSKSGDDWILKFRKKK